MSQGSIFHDSKSSEDKAEVNQFFSHFAFAPPVFIFGCQANKVIIQINYGTYLNVAISDINLLNVFRLFVSGAISYAIAEKFTVNRVSRRRLPRNPNGGGRCVVGCNPVKKLPSL